MPDLSGPFKPGEATNKGPGDGKPIKAHKDLQNKKHHERAWDNEETRDYSRSPWLVLLPDKQTYGPQCWRDSAQGHTWNGMSDKGVKKALDELNDTLENGGVFIPQYEKIAEKVLTGPITTCEPNEFTKMKCKVVEGEGPLAGTVAYHIRCVVPPADLTAKVADGKIYVTGKTTKKLALFHQADNVEDTGTRLAISVDTSFDLGPNVIVDGHDVIKEGGKLLVVFKATPGAPAAVDVS